MEKDQGSHESLNSDGKGKRAESSKNPNTLWGPVPLLPLSSYYDRSLPVSMAENNPTPAVDCDESLGNGEEFVMLRVSTDKTRCWPTYLGTNRTVRRDGEERPTTMSVADILREAEEQ
jgi:hypothetical protein